MILVFSLSACGGDFPKAEANVDPAAINWGSGAEGDRWYPDGKEGDNYLVITRAQTGKDCYICQSVSKDGKTELTCTAKDGHLVTPGEIVDFIFPDEFTAYDTLSETYFTRGDKSALETALYDLTFTEKTDATNDIRLSQGGKCKENFAGNTYSGTWRLTSPNTLCLSFEDDDFPYEFTILKDDDGNVTGLKQGDQGRRFQVKSTGGGES